MKNRPVPKDSKVTRKGGKLEKKETGAGTGGGKINFLETKNQPLKRLPSKRQPRVRGAEDKQNEKEGGKRRLPPHNRSRELQKMKKKQTVKETKKQTKKQTHTSKGKHCPAEGRKPMDKGELVGGLTRGKTRILTKKMKGKGQQKTGKKRQQPQNVWVDRHSKKSHKTRRRRRSKRR